MYYSQGQSISTIEAKIQRFRESLERCFKDEFKLPEQYSKDLSDNERNGFISAYQYIPNQNIPTPNSEFWIVKALAVTSIVYKSKTTIDNQSFLESITISEKVARIRNSVDSGSFVYDLRLGPEGINVGNSMLVNNHFWLADMSFSIEIYCHFPKTITGEIIV